MKLAIDIGNTQIKFGVFNNHKLLKSLHFNDSSNISKKLESFKEFNPSIIIISSVVPLLTSKYIKEVSKTFKANVFIINYMNCNINLNVPCPETVGTDRICNIAAALKFYSLPAIVIDFGTATTYDAINKIGDFIGGVIAPGVKTSADYLINKAALLSPTDLSFPSNVIGKNTKENIQSGIMYGALDQIEGMIKRINKETEIENNIILTGGFSQLLSPKLSINHTLDIDLTLKGMIAINESNN